MRDGVSRGLICDGHQQDDLCSPNQRSNLVQLSAGAWDIVVLHTGTRQEIKLLNLGVEESPITPQVTSSWLGFSYPSFSHLFQNGAGDGTSCYLLQTEVWV